MVAPCDHENRIKLRLCGQTDKDKSRVTPKLRTNRYLRPHAFSGFSIFRQF